jgi:hypothetical protein
MRITRRFLVAPSLARLIEKERGGRHVTEGYFADQPRGSTCVRLEEGVGSLILVRHGSGRRVEEVTDLPQGHAEALLDLAQGGVGYRRIPLSLGPRGVQLLRFAHRGHWIWSRSSSSGMSTRGDFSRCTGWSGSEHRPVLSEPVACSCGLTSRGGGRTHGHGSQQPHGHS